MKEPMPGRLFVSFSNDCGASKGPISEAVKELAENAMAMYDTTGYELLRIRYELSVTIVSKEKEV